MIKKLFSIEIEGDIARSLHMQKIQRPVISRLIAEAFGCPEVSFITMIFFSSFIQHILKLTFIVILAIY